MEMEVNVHRLKIIGSGNNLKIQRNEGKVIVVGHNNSIEIIKNLGQVEYIEHSATKMDSSGNKSKLQNLK